LFKTYLQPSTTYIHGLEIEVDDTCVVLARVVQRNLMLYQKPDANTNSMHSDVSDSASPHKRCPT